MSKSFDAAQVAAPLDEYGEGSIIFLGMESFLAYDSCSLYPGPYMNMVVGPNGTGKSTIVAALALGLGWPPSVLGRSNEISEFIRYGSEFALIHVGLRLVRPLSHILDKIMEGKTTYDGTIKDITDREEYVKLKNREINIKNNVEVDEESFDADGVLLITRRIERSTTRGASNDWSVNGQRTNQRIVSSIMAQLNIQIDNLCQFLPQDKVSQFAAQTPAELLVETQKAGAPPFVHVLHSKLIELRKKEVDFLNKSTSAREEAISLRQVNEQVDAVRERMRAREEHQLIINRCQKKRPWLLYNEAIAESLSRKADLETNRRVLDTALADQKPLLEAVENAKDEVESLKSNIESENLKTKKKLPLNKHASADKTGYGIDANVQKLQGEIETERKSLHEIGNAIRGKRDLIFKQREAAVKKAEEIKKLRDDISALERDVKALNKKLPGKFFFYFTFQIFIRNQRTLSKNFLLNSILIPMVYIDKHYLFHEYTHVE